MAKKNFVLRIDEAVLCEIRDLAKVREVTMANLVRGIIMDYLKNRNTQVEVPAKPKERAWWL
jgi:hypothetical protein